MADHADSPDIHFINDISFLSFLRFLNTILSGKSFTSSRFTPCKFEFRFNHAVDRFVDKYDISKLHGFFHQSHLRNNMINKMRCDQQDEMKKVMGGRFMAYTCSCNGGSDEWFYTGGDRPSQQIIDNDISDYCQSGGSCTYKAYEGNIILKGYIKSYIPLVS